MKLYHHKTDGGAEYLCSKAVSGTNEGSLKSKYIVRIDGNIKKDAELLITEETKTEIVKLWDNKGYEYPLIEIKGGTLELLKKDIKNCQKSNEYSFDDFTETLEEKDYFIRYVCVDEEVFF